MVTGDDIALLVHTQATVSIAIISKTDIQALLHHELLQTLDVGGAGIVVNVQAVGLIVDDVSICAQGIEHRLCNVPRTAVCTVQTNLDTLEGVDTQRDQVAHVSVAPRHIIHRAANIFPVSKGQLRPILVEHVEFAIDVILHQQQGLFRHLLTVAIDQLDTVIIVRVVAGRNHDATVEVVHAGDISHRRRGRDVQQIGICAGGC